MSDSGYRIQTLITGKRLRPRRPGVAISLLLLILSLNPLWVHAGPADTAFEWLLGRVNEALPGSLVYEKINASFTGPIIIEKLSYEGDGTVFTAERLKIDWSLASMLRLTAQIERVEMSDVVIRLPAAPAEKERPERTAPVLSDFKLPINIKVDDVDITNVSIYQADQDTATVIDQIRLRLETRNDTFLISNFTFRALDSEILISGKIKPVGDYPLEFTVDLQHRGTRYGPLAGNARIEGNIAGELELQQTISGSVTSVLDARLSQLLENPGWQLALTVDISDPGQFRPDLAGIGIRMDLDSDGTLDATSVSIVSSPLHGMVSDNGAGVLTYTHDGGADTSDSFTYTVLDNEGAISNEATVSVAIGAVPPVVTGLVFQLESDLGLGLNGNQVTSWSDISGSGYTLTSAGNPQQVISAELGNQPVVDFDGVGDKLEIASGLSGLPTGNADRTVYLVANYRGVGFGGFAYGNAACNQAFGTSLDNQGFLMAQGWCGSEDYSSNEVGTGAGWLVQSIVYEAGVMRHYKDGVLIDTQSHNYNTVLDNLVLGGELADNNFMNMQVAAALIYDRALNATEAQQVEDYLQNKY